MQTQPQQTQHVNPGPEGVFDLFMSKTGIELRLGLTPDPLFILLL